MRDLDQSFDFWSNVIGLEVISKEDESGEFIDNLMNLKDVRVTTIKMKDSNGMIVELLNFSSHQDNQEWTGKAYSTGITHIALNVDSINNILLECKRRGFPTKQAPQTNQDGSLLVMYSRGPDNVILELVENKLNRDCE